MAKHVFVLVPRAWQFIWIGIPVWIEPVGSGSTSGSEEDPEMDRSVMGTTAMKVVVKNFI